MDCQKVYGALLISNDWVKEKSLVKVNEREFGFFIEDGEEKFYDKDIDGDIMISSNIE